MNYFKRLDLVIGLDFHNFVFTLVTNLTLGQKKRESFDNSEFLNKKFPASLIFTYLIIVLNDARFSADFI